MSPVPLSPSGDRVSKTGSHEQGRVTGNLRERSEKGEGFPEGFLNRERATHR